MRSEERYRLLFENVKEAVFITTPDGRYIDVNPAYVEMFGYASREEMLRLDIAADIYANQGERERFSRLLEEKGSVKDYRLEMRKKDGERLVVLATAAAARDRHGKVVEYQGINYDITGLEREREKLKDQLEQLDLALKSADMGVWSWDIPVRRVFFDDRACRLLGIDPSTFTGTVDEYYKVVLPEDRAAIRAALYGSFKEEDPYYKQSYRVVLPDGTLRNIMGRWKVDKDAFGKPSRVHGILWDVTDRKKTEEDLKQATDLLRAIIDTAPTAIVGLDLDGKVRTVWNRAAERMLGWSEEEAMGRLLPIVSPENEEEFRQHHGRIRRGKNIDGLEIRRKKSDGAEIDLGVYASPLIDDNGTVTGSIGVLVDITERKRVEEVLRKSEERLKATLDAAQMVAFEIHVDGSHREVGPVDKLFGRPAGYSHPTLSDLFAAIHPEDRENVQSMMASALRGESGYDVQFRVFQEDGAVRWIEATGALQRDGKGNPVRILGMARNVTRRQAAEEALRRSEERFRRMIRNSNDIIALVDGNNRLTSVSGPLEKVLGYGPEEVKGAFFLDFVHPEDQEEVGKATSEIIRGPEESRILEFRVRHKDGKWVSVEAVSSNLLKDPSVKAIVSNIRDVTERNRLREQLQQAMKMEAVGRLAGGVAHDFNNILTVVTGNVELARMSLSPSDPLIRCLDQITKASDSAASLTRQLLAFSRKQIIEPKVLNLNELVGNVQQMLGRLIGENVELRTALDSGLASVKVDPGQFEQVLVNLAVNARDAMPDGGRLVVETANATLDEGYCATHPTASPGEYVLLAVSDTGHGMTARVKEHLFEPFFTTKGKGHGTGLGLATTFGVVRQAGGSIEVYSEEGRGTSFKIYIPAVKERAEKLVKETRTLDTLKGNETILLVEDEESVRKLALAMLKNLGYRVIEARDGEEALMLADRHGGKIDLLMTDIVMPGINGRELSERLTRAYPAMKTLFTSGYTEDVIVRHGVIDSQLNFIGKPYSLQGIARKIREALGSGTSAGA